MKMVKRPATARGRTKTDWLDSRHTFSFGNYHDPAYMGFRSLLVLNDDIVEPGKGFSPHGHRNMEILGCVLAFPSDLIASQAERGNAGSDLLFAPSRPSGGINVFAC
jgi:hypothetical protein